MDGAKGRRESRLALAFGVAGLLTAAAAIATAISSVHRSAASAPQLTLGTLHFTYPRVNAAGMALLALGLGGVAVIAIAVRVGWGQWQAYRRFLAALPVIGPLEGRLATAVIDDPLPQAFCGGYLRPVVYVSRVAMELLSETELEAVLAHENHHRRVRDPLRLACDRVLCRSLFFLPCVKALCDRDADVAELRADRAAVQASRGDRSALASALLAFDDAQAARGAGGISPERIDSLMGRRPSWRPPWRRLGFSICTLVGIGATLSQAAEVACAHATFNLPLVSAQPCLAITILGAMGAVRLLRHRLGPARTVLYAPR